MVGGCEYGAIGVERLGEDSSGVGATLLSLSLSGSARAGVVGPHAGMFVCREQCLERSRRRLECGGWNVDGRAEASRSSTHARRRVVGHHMERHKRSVSHLVQKR